MGSRLLRALSCPGRRAGHWAFATLSVAFLAVATLYNAATPVFEAPDELQHVAYLVWLIDANALPVVNPEEPGPWSQEGTQPPLYYWVAARLLGRLAHDAADQLADLNPHAAIGVPLHPGNKNYVLHDLDSERWPYHGTALFVHLARGISTLMALGTLGALCRLGSMVFPHRKGISLGIVGLVAFTPQFLFLSTSVNNDNLVILTASWVLVILSAWLCAPQLPGWLPSIALGALLGMAVLAKSSGLLLFPLAGGTMLWLAWRHKRLAVLAPWGLLVLSVALAVCGWWFLRNQRLYGDLTGIGVHLQIMGARSELPSTAEGFYQSSEAFDTPSGGYLAGSMSFCRALTIRLWTSWQLVAPSVWLPTCFGPSAANPPAPDAAWHWLWRGWGSSWQASFAGQPSHLLARGGSCFQPSLLLPCALS